MPPVNYDAHFFAPDPRPLLRKAIIDLPNNSYQPGAVVPLAPQLADGSLYAAMRTQVWPAVPINTGIDLITTQRPNTRDEYILQPISRAGNQAYFLPWYGAGCATSMTLPNPPASNYFFTSSLAGCSVIVTNTLQNPTIYHCGIESHLWGANGRPQRPADVPAFWRDMVNYISANAIIGEANPHMYRRHPAVSYHRPCDGPNVQTEVTPDARDCMDDMIHDDYVTLRNGNRVRGGVAVPCGSFFGYYAGGQWHFYLQQNLFIKHDGLYLRGAFKALRRILYPVTTRRFRQRLPWRLRHLHVVPLAQGRPTFTDRDWEWDDVKDGNLWLP